MRKKTDGGGNWGNIRRLAACFDPLDGSGNADASICTGTVVSFCICLMILSTNRLSNDHVFSTTVWCLRCRCWV